jgi:hypothetical protein
MNHFGKLFAVNIFGESHGESVGIVIDGCPAGMPLAVEDFIKDTERRKAQHQDRKMTCQFLKVDCLMGKPQVRHLPFYSKTRIPVPLIMKSNEQCLGPDTQIL